MEGHKHTGPAYPGAPVALDDSSRARRDAERCHILPPRRGLRVMTQGVFDILHLGHLHYFQAARALGDELVVVIARDDTVARNKHAPIFNEDARAELVGALDPVDFAVLGHRGDFYRVVEEIRPDIIAIGYDQPFDAEAIEAECARRGLTVRVERLPHMDFDLDSTRKVVEAIGEKIARKELYQPTPDRPRPEPVGVQAKEEAGTTRPGEHAARKVNRPRDRDDSARSRSTQERPA